MPTPREAYVNTVERQPIAGARVRAADYGASGEIMGRAAQGFGRDLQQVGQDLDDTRTILAVSDSKRADTAYMIGAAAITQGYGQLEKGDATTGRAKALEDLDKLGQAQSAQLTDTRARQMFDEQSARRKAEAAMAIDSHFRKETLAESDDTSSSRESASKIVAIDAPTEEAMFSNIETAITEKWSRMRGASKESKALEAYGLRSEVLAKRAQAITTPIAQEQFRQKYSAMISPEHEAVLIRSNQAGLTDAQSAFRANDFAAWRAGGKTVAPQNPGSQVTHIDDAGAEVPPSGLVPIDVPPSTVAGRPAAAPRATTAVVQGAHYDPTRGIGTVTATAAQHRARNGGTGRVAIDTAAPVGTAIYPPVRGKVIEAPREQRGNNGYMVRVDYGDGLVGTYIHMKSPSPLKAGDVVDTSAVVGLVGSTGRSTGAHVDYSVTKNGAVVNPNNVTYRGHGGEGTTSTLDQYKPDDADTTQLVADVRQYAKAAGLSQVEERTLLRDQMEVVNFNRGLQQDKERIAERAAAEWFVGIGDRNFKISDVPGFSELSPGAQQGYISAQEIRSRPKEPEAGGKDYVRAMVTAENEPEAFRSMDLDAMPLAKEERTRLKIKQGTLSNSDGSPKKSAIEQHDLITGRLNTYLKMSGVVVGNADLPKELEEREELRGFVEREIVAEEAKKKGPLTFNEVDTIVQFAVTKTFITRNGKREAARRYEVNKGDPTVQDAVVRKRERARYALRKKKGGLPVSEQEVDEFIKDSGL